MRYMLVLLLVQDTFLDAAHVRESFPQYDVQFSPSSSQHPPPPYRVTFPQPTNGESAVVPVPGSLYTGPTSKDAVALADGPSSSTDVKPVLAVVPYTPVNPGPYPQDQPRQNHVRFTPVQVEAIRAGVQPGEEVCCLLFAVCCFQVLELRITTNAGQVLLQG